MNEQEQGLMVTAAIAKGLDRAIDNGFTKKFEVAMVVRAELEKAGFIITYKRR